MVDYRVLQRRENTDLLSNTVNSVPVSFISRNRMNWNGSGEGLNFQEADFPMEAGPGFLA